MIIKTLKKIEKEKLQKKVCNEYQNLVNNGSNKEPARDYLAKKYNVSSMTIFRWIKSIKK